MAKLKFLFLMLMIDAFIMIDVKFKDEKIYAEVYALFWGLCTIRI